MPILAGLFLLLSVMEKVPTLAAHTGSKGETTEYKERAVEWVKSISYNEVFMEQGISANTICNTLVVLRREGQETETFFMTPWKENIENKAKSTEKIDGAVATIMALDRAIRCGNTNSASVYDERGILFL